MSELQPPPPPPPPPPLGSINGLLLGSREGTTTTTTTTAITTAVAAVGIPLSSDRQQQQQQQQQQSLSTKRQRRPSVRLGDIGDHNTAATTQSYESYLRSTSKQQWKDHNNNTHNNFSYRHPSHFLKDPKSSKNRPLTNLTNTEETIEGGDGKLNKPRRSGSKRIRSNWVSNDGSRDLDENSDTPLKELGVTSPIHSIEENPRKQIRGYMNGQSDDEDDGEDGDNDDTPLFIIEDGVQNWLNGLGLGRYGPVFELHEVDEEVLPLLTLDDLKDMGINAVGSRRKMYCAIEKLGKGFS